VAEEVSTVTTLVPATPAGELAITLLSETTLKDVAGVDPKWTASVSTTPLPRMVTSVCPATGPEFGMMEEITGDGWNSKISELSEPPAVIPEVGKTAVGAGVSA
jgi:hypothetical protein